MPTKVKNAPVDEVEQPESAVSEVDFPDSDEIAEGEFEDIDPETPPPPDQTSPPMFSPVSKAQTKIKAHDIREKIIFPEVPGEVITFQTYLEWVDLLTKTHKDNLEIYQYRKYPLTDHRLIDPTMPAYVEFYSGIDGGDLPTMDGVLTIHGGGTYRFDVCDATKPRNRKMFEVKLDIDWREHPPKIPDLRVVRTDIRKNAPYIQWLITEGLATLDEDNKIVPSVNIVQRGSQGGDTVNADRLVERLLNKLDDVTNNKGREDPVQTAVLLEAIKSQSAGNIEQIKATWDLVKSGGNQFDILTALEKLDKIRGPQGGGDNQQLMTMLMGMMAENQKHSNQMALEMMKLQGKAQSNPQTTGIKEIVELIPILQGLGGGGKPGKTEWWETLAEHGAPVVQTALQTFQTAMSLRAGMQPQQPQPGSGSIGGQPQPNQPQQPGLPPATGGYGAQALAAQRAAQEGQEGTPMPDQTQPQQPMAQQPSHDELMQMLDAYGNIILDGMLNQEGHYFANHLLQMFGQRAVPIYNLIRTRGPQAVVDVMKSNPNFWSQLQSATPGDVEPQVLAWVTDFINYEERLREEEEGETPPVEVVPPGPPAPPTQ